MIVELAYDVVHQIDNKNWPWIRIELPSKLVESGDTGGLTEGFVTSPHFRTPNDYRARFERQGERRLADDGVYRRRLGRNCRPASGGAFVAARPRLARKV